MSEENKQDYALPLWLRIFNLFLGIGFIGLSIFAISYEDLTIRSVLLVFALVVGLSGVIRIINAFYDKDLGGTKRIFRFVVGSILVLIALTMYLFPNLGNETLYVLLAIALFMQGIGRVGVAFTHKGFPVWVKILQFLMAAVSIIIGIVVLLPNVADVDLSIDLLLLLVVAFFTSGLSRFTMALVGMDVQKRD